MLTNQRQPFDLIGGYAPAPAAEPDPVMEFARRWWWLLALGVLLGAAVAVAYSRLGPVTYSSSALIQVSPNTDADPTDKAGQARSAATNFAAEGESTRMYDLVSQALPPEAGISAEDLDEMARSGQLNVEQRRGTNFIEVTVLDPDAERAQLIADTFAATMVADVNSRGNEQARLREQELQNQIDFTRQQLAAAELFSRERQLQADLRDQQQRLLTLQASYQQEQARQLEFERLSEGEAAGEGILQARADFERILADQIQDVEANIASLSAELEEVRQLISELPEETDPLISTAYASAYSAQLTSLTSQYVKEQIDSLSAGPSLVQFGAASTSPNTPSLKKLGFFGVLAGGVAAAALGFFIDFWRNRQDHAGHRQLAGEGQVDLDSLLHELEQRQVISRLDPAGARSADEGKTGTRSARP